MAAKKTSASKTSGKAASKHKAASKKAAAKKLVIKKTALKKGLVKKASLKKTRAKKSVFKKTVIKKANVKKALVKKAGLKKTTAKKPIVKTADKKTAAKKIGAKKVAAKKAIIRHPVVKKIAVKRPASNVAVSARVSKAVSRNVRPSKSAEGSAKKPSRQTALSFNPPPVTPPSRRPASMIPRTKEAKEPSPKLATSVRVPIRTPVTPRRAARSAARGVAPGAAQKAASLDQKPRQSQKPKGRLDEALSEQKLREAIRTAVLSLEAWLKNSKADVTPALAGLAAPAEAARAQIWRWLDREAHFEDGRILTAALLEDALNHEMVLLRKDAGEEVFDAGFFVTAAQLFLDLAFAPTFEDFPSAATRLLD